MRKVLVVYYTQTGQLKTVIDSTLKELIHSQEVAVDFLEIQPETSFPFPWTSKEFFDSFPECVLEIPLKLKPFNIKKEVDYDLVVLAYQPWYLSPSTPMTSFLQTEEAKKLMSGKEVVTLIACRNMWLQGQEKLKRRLVKLNSNLVGNIVLFDRSYNLISVYTILRWMLYGKKGNSGVKQIDIENAAEYGKYILKQMKSSESIDQNKLVQMGAVHIIPNLASLEKTATKLFYFFANFVRKKGGPGDPKRRLRVRMFGLYLLIGIVILSPLTTVIYYLLSPFKKSKIEEDKKYFQGISLRG